VLRRRKFTLSTGKMGWSPKPHASSNITSVRTDQPDLARRENHSRGSGKLQTDRKSVAFQALTINDARLATEGMTLTAALSVLIGTV